MCLCMYKCGYVYAAYAKIRNLKKGLRAAHFNPSSQEVAFVPSTAPDHAVWDLELQGSRFDCGVKGFRVLGFRG